MVFERGYLCPKKKLKNLYHFVIKKHLLDLCGGVRADD
jgi:hypothetical protein